MVNEWPDLLLGRDRCNGLQDPAGDLVWVPLGVRAAIFQVTLVSIVREAMRHANGRTAVRDAVVEFVDRLGFVQTRETEMIVRAVDRDVLVLVLVERSHKRFEVGLTTHFTQMLGREVRVHPRTVPIDFHS